MYCKISFVLFATWILATTHILAQQVEPALARVIYEFTHINDTLQPDKPHKEEMVLYVGQQTSHYTTFSNERINQQIKKQVDDPAFDGNLTITGGGRTVRESYYTLSAQRLFKQVYNLAGFQYIIDEPFPEIAWEITDESRDIGGYTTQKATGHFNGRDYVAWFTVDLPFQAAPWKLLGLPGLVLEATDSKSQVMFHYAGFETLQEPNTSVSLPENVIEANKKALDRLIDAHQKNPQAFMDAQSKAGSPRAQTTGSAFGDIDPNRIKSINVKRDASQTSAVDNNPMELTD